MDMKNNKYLFFFLMLFLLGTTYASENILIERYEQWNHPVLTVLKRYDISLYKVSYSQDGTCPTFYAKFKYDPKSPPPNSSFNYKRAYQELFKANSSFPYALVDEERNIKVNVGWLDEKQQNMFILLGEASSPSLCNNGNSRFDNDLKELYVH